MKSARSAATSTRVRRSPRLACSSWVSSRSSSTSRLSRVAAWPMRSTDRRWAAGSSSRSRRLSTYPPMSASGVRSSCGDRGEEARPELLGRQVGAEITEHDDGPRLAAGHRAERCGDRDLGAVGASRGASPRPRCPTGPRAPPRTGSAGRSGARRGRTPPSDPMSSPELAAGADVLASRSPSSDDAARLTRTTRRVSSTATMPSFAPSRIAARSACSPASASRSWAARNAIASSWRTSARRRMRSGGSEAPSGGRSAMNPTVREPGSSSPISRRSSSVTPCQPLGRTQASASATVANASGTGAASGYRAGVGLRGAQAEHPVSRRGQPERPGDRVADADELADDARGHDAEVAAERDELAQLVLGEHRVRLALRVLEDPATLAGDDSRRPATCGVAGCGSRRVRSAIGRGPPRGASPAPAGSTRSRPGPGGRATARRAAARGPAARRAAASSSCPALAAAAAARSACVDAIALA